MRAYLHGHPEGRRIKPDEYQGERQEVHKFFEHHSKHAAVIAALSFFDKWLKDGAEGLEVPAKEDMHRLSTQGVTPMDMLVEVSAVWLLSRRRPRVLPDGLALTYALATSLLYLRPRIYFEVYKNGEREMRPERYSGTKRRLVGNITRSALGVFFLNLEATLEREHKERVEQTLAIRTPFNPTTPPQGGQHNV